MVRVGGSRSVAAAIAAVLALSACGEGKPGGEAVIPDARAAMRAVTRGAIGAAEERLSIREDDRGGDGGGVVATKGGRGAAGSTVKGPVSEAV